MASDQTVIEYVPEALAPDQHAYDSASFSTTCEKEDIVGSGSYASVQRCFHENLEQVVVKILIVSQSDASSKLKEFKKRVKAICNFEHKNIVKTFGYTHWSHCFGIIMEEVTHGNLLDFILSQDIPNISWFIRLQIFLELSSALDYLHTHNTNKQFLHKDLKSENILLSSNLSVKLADFGSFDIKRATGALTSTDIPSNNQHTCLYAAPEVLKGNVELSYAVDVYSFSIVGFEIIVRKRVYTNKSGNVVAPMGVLIQNIKEGLTHPNESLLLEIEESLESSKTDVAVFRKLSKIIIQCWHYEPNMRPPMSDISGNLNEFIQTLNMFEEKNKIFVEEHSHKLKRTRSIETDRKSLRPLNYLIHPNGLSIRGSEFDENQIGASSLQPSSSSSSRKKHHLSRVNNLKLELNLAEEFPLYDMNHFERGHFVIFNQERFSDNSLQDRKGSQHDVLVLQDTLVLLGFKDIRIVENANYTEILQLLYKLSLSSHDDYDCFGCAIFSYGRENDMIYASDKPFSLSECTSFFTASNCPSLAGKPKLFFVQSSRSFGEPSEDNRVLEDTGITLQSAQSQNNYADFLIMHSCLPGFHSYRNMSQGSLFIQTLCHCLKQHGTSKELLQILTLVCNNMADGSPSIVDMNHTQISSIISRLTKFLYFNSS